MGNMDTPLTSSSMEDLAYQKRIILHETAQCFGHPRQREAQELVNIWKHHRDIPYPEASDCIAFENGSLLFTFHANNQPVLMSVWMMFGEIRIGLKIPAALARDEDTRDRLSRLYDGNPCPRQNLMTGFAFFDWIFRDSEFSRFDFMVSALRDPLLASVIADRISQIMIHLYLALTDFLIEHQCTKITIRVENETPVRAIIAVSGDRDYFIDFASRHLMAVVDSVNDGEDNISSVFQLRTTRKHLHKLTIDAPYKDEDNRLFFVSNIETFDEAL